MLDTKIRWADHSWNPMTGCTKISEGCDNCYAEVIATKFSGSAFPVGFEPTFKPHILSKLRRLTPGRVFVNSMSDIHHNAFTYPQVKAVYDEMLATEKHDYLVLTKRPNRMKAFITQWLEDEKLAEVPDHIWLGTSIELDKWTRRADVLRSIPAAIRFLSCEPLLGPLPNLNLSGIHWVIVGGESGKGYRGMDHDWARELRDMSRANDVAFFFKQSAAYRTELGIELDGELIEEYPKPHPASLLKLNA